MQEKKWGGEEKKRGDADAVVGNDKGEGKPSRVARGKAVGKAGERGMEAGCCGREARTTEAGKVTEDGRR